MSDSTSTPTPTSTVRESIADIRTPHPDCTIDGPHKRHRWTDFEFGTEEVRCPGRSFVPEYDFDADTRIHRQRLTPNEGGVATVRFRGIAGDLWVEQGSSGRLSLFTEVTASEDVATVLRVAIVPTGKRVPLGQRLGSARGLHAYLLSRETAAPQPGADADGFGGDAPAVDAD